MANRTCDHKVAKMGSHQVAMSEFNEMARNWVLYNAKNALTGFFKTPFAYHPKFDINLCCTACGAKFDRQKYIKKLKELEESSLGWWL